MNVTQRRQWREYVYGCPGLTVAQRVILLALADFSDWPSGTNARPGVERLAEICGACERSVKEALRRGRDLKLIHQTARANPKRHLAAVYRLVPAPISECTDVHVETDSRCTDVHVETDFKVQIGTFQGANQDISRCTPMHPTKPLTPSPITPSPLKESGASATAPPATELVPDGDISAELFPPPQTAKTAKTRAAKTPFPEGWRPTSQQMAGFTAKYPALDIDWEFAAFENDAYAAGRFYANWLRAFAGWLHRGGSYRKPTNGHQTKSKVRTLAELAEKARRMEDLTGRAIEA